jgi:hypothetical protein
VRKISLISIIAFGFFFDYQSYGQTPTCPSCNSQQTLQIDVDKLPICGVAASNTYLSPNQLTCTDPNTFKCYSYKFFRASNSLTQQFNVSVGQGNSCNGELDATYLYVNGVCSQLSFGGSGTAVTFTFPIGVNELTLSLCVNSGSKVCIKNVCRQPPPCNPAPVCNLPSDVNLIGCTIPPALTIPSSVFTNTGTCTGAITMTSMDDGDKTVCDGANFTRTYTLFFNGNPFKTCSQNIIVTPPPLNVVCPAPVNLDACQSQTTILAAYNAWKAGFLVSSGCNATSNISSIPTLPPYSCNAVDLSFTLSAQDACNSIAKTCTSTFYIDAVGTNVQALTLSCPPQ